MTVAEAVELLNRASTLERELGIRALFENVTGKSPDRHPAALARWLGTLSMRLAFVLGSTDRLSEIGYAFDNAGLSNIGLELVRAFWDRIDFEVNVYGVELSNDIARSFLESTRTQRRHRSRNPIGRSTPKATGCVCAICLQLRKRNTASEENRLPEKTQLRIIDMPVVIGDPSLAKHEESLTLEVA